MAKTTIPKKKIGVMQDAIMQTDSEDSWSLKENAKEGLTTLKKNSEKIIVYATRSSVEDVKKILDKAGAPYDEVNKLEGDPEYMLTGKNAKSVCQWDTWTMSCIGENLAEEDKKSKDVQKQFDKGIGAWLHEAALSD